MPRGLVPTVVPPTGFDRRGEGLRETAGRAKQAVRARQARFSVGMEETPISWMNMGFKCKGEIWT